MHGGLSRAPAARASLILLRVSIEGFDGRLREALIALWEASNVTHIHLLPVLRRGFC